VAIESVTVAVFLSFTAIVRLLLAGTKDFLVHSDLQGRVESGNDSLPHAILKYFCYKLLKKQFLGG
jgi:hypothetical protein